MAACRPTPGSFDVDPGLPATEISGTISAHVALASTIEALTDEVARRPSLLPDWSVGHVLTHLARNADSVVRRLQAAAEGRVVDQYAGGAEGRKQDIEAGAGRPAGALVGYVPADWPDDLVERWLPRARQRFLATADERDLLAWLVGRGPAPRLAPWG